MGIITTMTFELTGPHAGKTVRLGGRNFVNGQFVARGTPEEFAGLAKLLGDYYQAFPVGSAELIRRKEAARGAGTDRAGQVGAAGAPGAELLAPAEVPEAVELAAANSEAGAEGVLPDRDGHADARLARDGEELIRVAAAVKQLDPRNGEHWAADGRPAVAAVAELLGRPVSRAVIDLAAPDVRRPRSSK